MNNIPLLGSYLTHHSIDWFVMIDKIVLSTKDFQIKDFAPLTIKPGSYQYDTSEVREFELFHNERDDIVRAGNAFYNSEFYNIDINAKGLKVTLNPNRIHYSTNYYSVDEKQCKEALSKVERDLQEKGFLMDFKDTSLARIDIVKQIQTEHPFRAYTPLYRSLSGKRMKSRELGTTTYNYGNQSREIQCYDKIVQLVDDKKFKDEQFNYFGIDRNSNIARCELREKKSKPVLRDLNIQHISDFYRSGIFEHLTGRYRSLVSDLVFKKGIDESQLKFDFVNEIELLQAYKSAFQASDAIGKYIIFQFGGLDSLIEHYGSIDNFRQSLLDAGFARKTVYTILNGLEKGLSIVSDFRQAKRTSNIPMLYSELYDKLMAA